MPLRGRGGTPHDLDHLAGIWSEAGELRSGFALGSRERDNEHELEEFMASPRFRLLGFDAHFSEIDGLALRLPA